MALPDVSGTPVLDRKQQRSLVQSGPTGAGTMTVPKTPSMGETASALFRTETLLGAGRAAMLRSLSVDNSREARDAAFSENFSALRTVEDLVTNGTPVWGNDPSSIRKLNSTRSAQEFYFELANIEQGFADRSTLENSSLPMVLAQSVGVAMLDIPSYLVGGAAWSGLQLSKRAALGAGATYARLSAEQGNKLRYLYKRTTTNTGKKRQLKQLEEIEAHNAKMVKYADEVRVGTITGMASAALAETAAVEVAFRDQPGRTNLEVISNILGSVALSGVLGKGSQMYSAYMARLPQTILDLETKLRVQNGFTLLSEGTDSVNPVEAIDSPDLPAYSSPVDFLAAEKGYITNPSGSDSELDLYESIAVTELEDPDFLIDGARVTAEFGDSIEVPTTKTHGLRTRAADMDSDKATIWVNQEGDAVLSEGATPRMREDGVEVIDADIRYLNGGEDLADAEFSPDTIAAVVGYDHEAQAALKELDRSPVFNTDTGDAIPADRLEELEREYNVHPESTGESRWDEFTKARYDEAKKFLGVDSKGPMRLAAKLHLGLRLKTSESPLVRRIGGMITNDDYMEAGGYKNGTVRHVRAVDLMTNMDQTETQYVLRQIVEEGFDSILKKGADLTTWRDPSGWSKLRARYGDGTNVELDAMKEQVSRYIYSSETYKAEGVFTGMDEEIIQIARQVREKLTKKWETRQLDPKVKMLGKAVVPEGMAFYMPRVWNKEFIRQGSNSDKLIDRIKEEITEYKFKNNPDMDEAEIKVAIRDAEMEARSFVSSILDSRISIADQDIPWITPSSLKERAPLKSSNYMEYLDHNITRNVSSWVRNISPEYRLRESFGADYQQAIPDAIKDEFSAMQQNLSRLHGKATTNKERKSIDKEIKRLEASRKQANIDIKGAFEVLNNRFAVPDNPESKLLMAAKLMRSLNFSTKLGGMAVSSLVDPSYLIAKAGFGPAIKALTAGMGGTPFSGMRDLASGYRSRGTKEFMAFREDAHILQIVSELETHSRANASLMMQESSDFGTKVDEGISTFNAAFSRATFMSRWNDWVKSTSHMAYTLKIKRALDNPSDANRRFLAGMGINEKDGIAISKQWAAKSTKQTGDIDGNPVDFDAPNLKDWHLKDGKLDEEGAAAQDLMRASLNRAVNSTIVTPGLGDLPLNMRKPLGQLLLQFSAFPITVFSRVIIPAVQKAVAKGELRDVGELARLSTAIFAAMGVYVIKEIAANREPDLSWDNLLLQGIERSGLFGIYHNGITLANELSGDAVEKAIKGDDYVEGYRSRDPIMDALSPTWRTYQDIMAAQQGLVRMIVEGEDMTWSQGSAIRRLTPGNNLFYLKVISEIMQEWAMNADRPTKKSFLGSDLGSDSLPETDTININTADLDFPYANNPPPTLEELPNRPPPTLEELPDRPDDGRFVSGERGEELLDSVMRVESGGDVNAVSRVGAIGLYQLMPDTIADPGFNTEPITKEEALDPVISRQFARDYLNGIADTHPTWTQEEVLRAYNAGPGRMSRYKASIDKIMSEEGVDEAGADAILVERFEAKVAKIMADLSITEKEAVKKVPSREHPLEQETLQYAQKVLSFTA